MVDVSELIGRVEKATGPDRELDALVDATLRVGLPHLPEWAHANFPTWVPYGTAGRVAVAHDDNSTGLHWESQPFTASIDAALALVERCLPGAQVGLDPIFFVDPTEHVKWDAIICIPHWHRWNPVNSDWIERIGARHADKRLAILSALLHALDNQNEAGRDG